MRFDEMPARSRSFSTASTCSSASPRFPTLCVHTHFRPPPQHQARSPRATPWLQRRLTSRVSMNQPCREFAFQRTLTALPTSAAPQPEEEQLTTNQDESHAQGKKKQETTKEREVTILNNAEHKRTEAPKAAPPTLYPSLATIAIATRPCPHVTHHVPTIPTSPHPPLPLPTSSPQKKQFMRRI